jgi:hypothetical protein
VPHFCGLNSRNPYIGKHFGNLQHRGPLTWAARFTSKEELHMWANILTGAIMLMMEAWMQVNQWIYIG